MGTSVYAIIEHKVNTHLSGKSILKEMESRLGVEIFQRTSAHHNYYPVNQWYLTLLHGITGEWSNDLNVTWNTESTFKFHFHNSTSKDIYLFKHIAHIYLQNICDFPEFSHIALGKEDDRRNLLQKYRINIRHYAFQLGSREVMYIGGDMLGEMIDDEDLTYEGIIGDAKTDGANIWDIARGEIKYGELSEDVYSFLFTDDFSDLPDIV